MNAQINLDLKCVKEKNDFQQPLRKSNSLRREFKNTTTTNMLYFNSTYDCDVKEESLSLRNSPKKVELGLKINFHNSKSEKRGARIVGNNGKRNET